MPAAIELPVDDNNKIIVEETTLDEKYGGDHGVSIRKFYYKGGKWNPGRSGIFLSLTKPTITLDDSGEEVEVNHFEAVVDAALALLSEMKAREE